jgi:DNA-binding winged helix-turn-helix (wHTH) protein
MRHTTDLLALADRTVDLESGEVSTGDHLRPMELRVLRYLAGRAGGVVGVDALLQNVWRYAPGVRTRTVHSTLYRLRQAIEPRPKDPIHLVTVGSGVRLDARVQRRTPPTNLRSGRDRFVGREAELARLDATDGPIVSIVGPSGIGKTRLATEWGIRALPAYPGGVWWVDAGGSPEDLLARIGRCFDGGTAELAERVGSSRDVLLILDDLAPGTPLDPVAALERCRLLVTTHAPLERPGEERIRLGPLDEAVGLLTTRIRGRSRRSRLRSTAFRSRSSSRRRTPRSSVPPRRSPCSGATGGW